ncbi:MAG: hypothetical protein LBG80_17290 [Bacteroidales bacterium]|jgi:mannosyltransferase OCH1-like enzyme|nr:hypothetical protein [Bacteroidales bacterium]
MSNNRIVQGLWIDGNMSSLQLLCIKSFMANGHDFHLYTYNEKINAPVGTIIKSADSIINKEEIFFDDKNSLSAFSDMFRYELLYKNGGWWVDMDVVCLKSFDFDSEYVFSSEHDCNFRYNPNIGVIKVPPLSDIMNYCRNMAHEILYTNRTNVEWGGLGSKILISYFRKHELMKQHIQLPHIFCPIPYFYFNFLFNDILFDFNQNSYSIHFWNEMLRRNKIDLNTKFHPYSMFQRLKKMYNME